MGNKQNMNPVPFCIGFIFCSCSATEAAFLAIYVYTICQLLLYSIKKVDLDSHYTFYLIANLPVEWKSAAFGKPHIQ